MNEMLDHVLKGVSQTLLAIAHPDPITVVNAIRADYEIGDDLYKVIDEHLVKDEHIQNLMTAKDAQDMINQVNNTEAV